MLNKQSVAGFFGGAAVMGILWAVVHLNGGIATPYTDAEAKSAFADTPVAATVNGEPVYAGAVSAQLANIPAQLIQNREDEIRSQILNELIERELIRQAAKEAGIQNTAGFQQQMQQTREQLLTNTLLQQKAAEAVTDEALMARYEADKADLAFPAVKARHILVQSEEDAQDLLKIATPQNFAELAAEKSQGPSAQNGGDLGYFRREAMVPAFAEVAFSTPKGTIADEPVQTQFGWHVIYVEDKQDAYVPPVQVVANTLRSAISQQAIQDYVDNLRTDAEINIMDDKNTANKDQDDTNTANQ